MKNFSVLLGIFLMMVVVSCNNTSKDPLIYNPKSLKESVWTVADSVATPEQLAMKKKLNEMIWNCVQVKDNRLTLTVGKDYFKKNEIPEIYYDFTLESLKETNDGLDKWEKEGLKVDVDKLFEDAKKEYLTTKQK
jgi:hypothetical protein